MIVHTLKMCTSDAGPEQSLVLFSYFILVMGAKKNAHLIEMGHIYEKQKKINYTRHVSGLGQSKYSVVTAGLQIRV